MPSNGAIVIAGSGAIILGGAFVITMAGSQFFTTTDFLKYIGLPDHAYIIEPIDWISGASCAYVMVFSRCSKIYHDILKKLASNQSNENRKKEVSYCDSYSLPTHILNVLGSISGSVRGILLGFLGSLTLLNAVRIYNLTTIYGVWIYVGISNTVTYASFMVGQANKNTELAIQSLNASNSQEGAEQPQTFCQRRLTKKMLATAITLIAMIGSFSYFNYTTYSAFIQIPYLDRLSHQSAFYTMCINTVLTIMVGALAKGLQLYRYLNNEEENNAQQLEKISSAKIKSHFTIGAIYILFYTMTLFIGLINTFSFNKYAAIPLSIFVSLFSGALEYIFSVRIMINEERKRIFNEQGEQLPLLINDNETTSASLAPKSRFFTSPLDPKPQDGVSPINASASTALSSSTRGLSCFSCTVQ